MKKLFFVLLILAACTTPSPMKAQSITVYHNGITYSVSHIVSGNDVTYVATSQGQIVYKDKVLASLINIIFGFERSCVCEPCCDYPYQITVRNVDGNVTTWTGWIDQVKEKVRNVESITIAKN